MLTLLHWCPKRLFQLVIARVTQKFGSAFGMLMRLQYKRRMTKSEVTLLKHIPQIAYNSIEIVDGFQK